jgi:signal peptidase II
VTAFLVFLADYLTKYVAVKALSDEPVKVIGNFLKFELIFNTGAAFSLATSKTIFLSGFSIAVAAGILFFATRIDSMKWALALGLVLGGIFGNLSDRIFRSPGGLQGPVVDWISIPNWLKY